MRSAGRPRRITDEQILRAARAAVAVHGPGVPSLAIARLAGISEGSLFRRFATKAALVRAALALDEEEVSAPFTRLAREGDGAPRERLLAAAREFAHARARLALLDATGSTLHRRSATERRAAAQHAATGLVLGYLQSMARQGRIAHTADAELAAWASAYVSLLWGLPVDQPHTVDDVVPVLLRALGFVAVLVPAEPVDAIAEAS